MKKSDTEDAPRSPISFHPSSNGEFEPRPVTDRDRRAAAMYRDIVEQKARRMGMTRRQFTESASGMVAALFVLNEVYGCGNSGVAGGDASAGAGGTGNAGTTGSAGTGGGGAGNAGTTGTSGTGGGASGTGGAGGFSRDAGFDVPNDVSASDAMQGANDARYDVTQDTIEDAARADQVVAGQEFIFDVQTHNRVPAPPWNASTCSSNMPNMCPTAYLSGIFVESDTSVAVLSGYPSSRASEAPSTATRTRIKQIVDALGGSPRLMIHANVRPDEGTAELDAAAQDAMNFPVAAWKTYPPAMAGRGLDSDMYGRPFAERARQLGVKVIATHRGIGSGTDPGSWTHLYSPRDVGPAAAASPDIKFLVYHSGWQSGVAEDHPFNMMDTAPRGVDRLIKTVLDNGLGPTSNVYAELGTTWFSLMGNMNQAAHVIGKLLRYLGPDRILWGTDSYNNGGPDQQIRAFRLFEIPQSMQDMYGYPALTPEIKRKIFGLNACAVYGVDPNVVRAKITQDQISRIVLAKRDDPSRFPRGPQPHGPRTRREYLRFLNWEKTSVA